MLAYNRGNLTDDEPWQQHGERQEAKADQSEYAIAGQDTDRDQKDACPNRRGRHGDKFQKWNAGGGHGAGKVEQTVERSAHQK